MFSALTLLCVLSFNDAPVVESICQQVAPVNVGNQWRRSADQSRAVVLLHGFHLHFRDKNVPKAELRPWQRADSALVNELGKHADVFVFAYGQNVALDVIVKESNLAPSVAELRKLGYKEVVLLGHSAGGLIARQFVEDNPDAGVTKVIQICSPNGGSPLTKLTAPKSQKAFLQCLTADHRKKCLDLRCDKKIPDHVQFICVIAKSNADANSDGVVSCASQWTADLQKQGVGAVCVVGSHREVVRDAKLARTLAGLVREEQMRWPPERVEKTRKEVFRK